MTPTPFYPLKAPVRRKRKGAGGAAPVPPVALTLVSATYDDGNWVRLVFDRAIDAAGLDGTQVVVEDGNGMSTRYAATGAVTMVGMDGVQIGLVALGAWVDPGVLLDATDATGIVAADDGGAWAGVTDLGLPFP